MAGPWFSATADPDQGLAAYADLAEVTDLSRWTVDDTGWRRLVALLGGSAALGRWLRQRPADLAVVFDDLTPWNDAAIRADIEQRVGGRDQTVAQAVDELRWAYRRHLMRVAVRDLTAPDPAAELESVCAELSGLNDAVASAALAIARSQVPGQEKVRLGVVALGKTGAREVNYLSDVDVLFVAEPALDQGQPVCAPQEAVQIGADLAARMTNICSSYTAAGTIWEVDANLRPEGAAGPLVRSLAGMRAYYTTWASNWEFQAMLKARAMAGDLELAQQFVDLVTPLVWQAAGNAGFVAEAQAMRARVVALIPPGEAGRDIKLSSGGLRDTEFSVQMLQLVHGRSDERLRVAPTLAALGQLVAHGYVGRADGAELDQAYRRQRLLEHRLQLFNLRRTHLMPTDDKALRRLARFCGLKEPAQVVELWRSTAKTVVRLHQKIWRNRGGYAQPFACDFRLQRLGCPVQGVARPDG